MAKIGINGFGRIGRVFTRAALSKGVRVVAINDPFARDAKYMGYLFKYDSTHGQFCGNICIKAKQLILNGSKITIFKEKDPSKVPWDKVGVDYVVEASGINTSKRDAEEHLKGGVKKVILSAPCMEVPMIVLGVNHCIYDPSDQVISMASCTTNCCAPVAKVVHENFGIEEAFMTTIHAATLSQKMLDGVVGDEEDWRNSRGGLQNIVPDTRRMALRAARAVGKVIPDLDGKIAGVAFRVPVPDVSIVDLTVKLSSCVPIDNIKCALLTAANGDLKGILGYTEDEIVSSDVVGTQYSSIFDAKASIALNKHFVKLICWYDNEIGFSNRLVDLICFMKKKDAQCGCRRR